MLFTAQSNHLYDLSSGHHYNNSGVKVQGRAAPLFLPFSSFRLREISDMK
jgi:hypothetical protein